MKRSFQLASCLPDIEILARTSPMTQELKALVEAADFYVIVETGHDNVFSSISRTPVTAATDPWSEVEYQSLYLIDTDPENRIVLQEPPVKDPMVGVMVLKAARLRGESGIVYCGTPEQLKALATKLPNFEVQGDELDEKEFLECLVEAIEADGLKVIYWRLSEEHGGDADDE